MSDNKMHEELIDEIKDRLDNAYNKCATLDDRVDAAYVLKDVCRLLWTANKLLGRLERSLPATDHEINKINKRLKDINALCKECKEQKAYALQEWVESVLEGINRDG